MLYVTRRRDLCRSWHHPGQSLTKSGLPEVDLHKHDEPRRIAANIAKLPDLMKRKV